MFGDLNKGSFDCWIAALQQFSVYHFWHSFFAWSCSSRDTWKTPLCFSGSTGMVSGSRARTLGCVCSRQHCVLLAPHHNLTSHAQKLGIAVLPKEKIALSKYSFCGEIYLLWWTNYWYVGLWDTCGRFALAHNKKKRGLMSDGALIFPSMSLLSQNWLLN